MNEYTIAIDDLKEAATWGWRHKVVSGDIELDDQSRMALEMFCEEMNDLSGRSQWTRDIAGSCIVAAFLEKWVNERGDRYETREFRVENFCSR